MNVTKQLAEKLLADLPSRLTSDTVATLCRCAMSRRESDAARYVITQTVNRIMGLPTIDFDTWAKGA